MSVFHSGNPQEFKKSLNVKKFRGNLDFAFVEESWNLFKMFPLKFLVNWFAYSLFCNLNDCVSFRTPARAKVLGSKKVLRKSVDLVFVEESWNFTKLLLIRF